MATQPALSQETAAHGEHLSRAGDRAAYDAEAGVDFECPQTSTSGAPDRLPATNSGIYDMSKGAEPGAIVDRVGEFIAKMRAQNAEPDIIVDTLVAAYCPLVASERGLTAAQKKARVELFARQVTDIIFSDNWQQAREVLVNVPLSPDFLRKVDEAARGAGVSRDAWLLQAVEKALPVSK